MTEAGLHRPEASHRSAGRVVGPGGHPLHRHRVAPVGTGGVVDGVADHRIAGRAEGAAVQDDPRLDAPEGPVWVGLVAHPQLGRMPVDMAHEALGPAVLHLHRPPRVQGEQAEVDLEADILPRPEGAPYPGVVDAHRVLVHPQAGHDLVAVYVGPLGGDVEVDTALAVGNRQAGLGAERGLVLHTHLIVALHDHGAGHVLGASPAYGPVEHGVPAVGLLRVGERLQHLVLDLDGLHRQARGLRVIGGNQRHRLAPVLDQIRGEDGLVSGLQTEGIAARDIVADEDGVGLRSWPRRGRCPAW